MYKNAKLYKGVWMAPGSEGMRLLNDGKLKELDKLLKELDVAKRKLEGTYEATKGD